MHEDPRTMQFDEPCAACGYNLRGLAIGSTCPECGLVTTSEGLVFAIKKKPTWKTVFDVLTSVVEAVLFLGVFALFLPTFAKDAHWTTIMLVTLGVLVIVGWCVLTWSKLRWRHKEQKLLVDSAGIRWFATGLPPEQYSWDQIETIRRSTLTQRGPRIVLRDGRTTLIPLLFRPKGSSEADWIVRMLTQQPHEDEPCGTV